MHGQVKRISNSNSKNDSSYYVPSRYWLHSWMIFAVV